MNYDEDLRLLIEEVKSFRAIYIDENASPILKEPEVINPSGGTLIEMYSANWNRILVSYSEADRDNMLDALEESLKC